MEIDTKELSSAMEAILFAAGEAVDIKRICIALDLDRETVEIVLRQLGDSYSFDRRGIRLLRMELCFLHIRQKLLPRADIPTVQERS